MGDTGCWGAPEALLIQPWGFQGGFLVEATVQLRHAGGCEG